MIADYVIAIWIASMAAIGARLFYLLIKTKRKFFGKPFLNPYVFYAGKLALLGTWVAALFELIGITNNPSIGWAEPLIIALVVMSWFLVFPAEWVLGTRLKPGIPSEETELETRGVYRYTRHPLYLGAYFFGAASVLYAPSWYNALFFVVLVVVHQLIIREEEKYLAKKFKDKWRSYASKVPRFLF